MTIDKLAEALMLLRQHKLDDADVILLGELLNRWKEGKVTIMQLLENTIVGCEATAHMRLNRLCSTNILRKVPDEVDQRVKILVKGEKFNDLVNILEKV
ncbi:MAG: hypothetical protein EB069_03080 [Actinobacteria bacterium]|nr:hypothetical protein [Actinomycetota bacterium]